MKIFLITLALCIITIAIMAAVIGKLIDIPAKPAKIIVAACIAIFIPSLICTIVFAIPRLFDSAKTEETPQWVIELAEKNNAEQIFVVAGIGNTTAYVSMHEKKSDGTWKVITTTPGYIGKYGLGKTKEGDGMTPVGTFHFTEAFGIASDPGCIGFDYTKVNDQYYWSGDSEYKYNHMIKINEFPSLNMDDSEHIIDYNYQYQYCLNISYNEKGSPGLGSAIFLHCLGPYKPYTGGCVAIPKSEMVKVIRQVKSDCIVIIDSLQNLSPETWDAWGL